MSQPYPDGSELDRSEVVVAALVVARGDGAEMLEFAEEALDEVAIAIEERTEGRMFTRPGIGLTQAQAPRSAKVARKALLS